MSRKFHYFNKITIWLAKTLFILLVIFQGLHAQESHKVDRVIDGDTFVLDNGEKVRLIGIDTPEKGEKYFLEATMVLKELVEKKYVILTSDPLCEDRDWYKRLLRYVYVNGVDVNRSMIERGWARYYGKYRFSNKKNYAEAERQAQKNEVGLWKVTQTTAIKGKSKLKIVLVMAGIFLLLILGAYYGYKNKNAQ